LKPNLLIMKAIAYCFICSILLISCTFGINPSNYSNKFYDEFKDKHSFVLKQALMPYERNSNIQRVEFEFLTEIDSNNNDVQVFVNITRNIASQPIENQLYLKTDEKDIYILPLKIVDSKPKESNISETITTVSIDTAGVSHTSEATSNRIISWNSDNYTAIIPFEMVQKIKNSYAVTWRLYSGAIPATFNLNSAKMKNFNCFINQQVTSSSY
jgi:hypothetical protein